MQNVEIISSFSKEEVIQLTVLKEDLGTADAIGKILSARGAISLAQSVRLTNEQQTLESRPPSIRDFGTERYILVLKGESEIRKSNLCKIY